MAWSTSTGTVAAANSKVSSTTYTSGSITCPIGNQIILMIGLDNVGNATPTISSITVPGGETATWVRLGYGDSSSGTAGSGARVEVYGITPTQAWSAFSPVVTFTAAITAKSSLGFCRSGGSLNERDVLPTVGNTVVGTTPSIVSAPVPKSGDLVIAVVVSQTATAWTGDADTLNGSWSSAVSSATTGGTDNTNITTMFQTKIVTADGAQTFNPTNAVSSSGSIVIVSLATAGTTTAQVSRAGGEALIRHTPTAQVARTDVEALIRHTPTAQVARTDIEVMVLPDYRITGQWLFMT